MCVKYIGTSRLQLPWPVYDNFHSSKIDAQIGLLVSKQIS